MFNFKKGCKVRTAAQFVQRATEFDSEIKIVKNERLIEAKSIMSVMSTGIRRGEEITLIVNGIDEQEVIVTSRTFFCEMRSSNRL